MADQLFVAQQAQIGWSELALPMKGRFFFSDHEGGARATAFDAEKQGPGCRFLTFRHRAKYFRVRRFYKANADGGTIGRSELVQTFRGAGWSSDNWLVA